MAQTPGFETCEFVISLTYGEGRYDRNVMYYRGILEQMKIVVHYLDNERLFYLQRWTYSNSNPTLPMRSATMRTEWISLYWSLFIEKGFHIAV